MEVCVAHVDNVPEGCMLALTAGHSRRMAPLAARQKFAFGSPALNAAAGDGGAGMKIEVLTIQGGARLDAPNLQQAFGEKDGAVPTKSYRFEVPLQLATGVMKVGLSVKPAPTEKSRGEAHRRRASPDSGGEALVKKQRLVPVDELASSADEAAAALKPPPKAVGKHRHNVALEARTYLEEHRILPFVEEMMRVLVKERPAEPWGRIAELFPAAPPATEKDTAKEGSMYDLAATGPMPSAEATQKRWGFGRKTAVGFASTPSSRGKESPSSAPEQAAVASFAHIEFCLDNLDYQKLSSAPRVLQGVMAQVGGLLSSRAKPSELVSLEVEHGCGSVVVSSKLRCTSEGAAQDIKASVDSDSKGFLHEVEDALKATPGISEVIKSEVDKVGGFSRGFGARALRTYVRQKLMLPEDEQASQFRRTFRTTASTMLPSDSQGNTRHSWYSGGTSPASAAGGPDATMIEEGVEGGEAEAEPLPDYVVPENVCTSGQQLLRKALRSQLLQAGEDGGLHSILDARQIAIDKSTKKALKETLLTVLRGGNLVEHLQKAKEYKTDDMEQMRLTAKSRILSGLGDGSLEAALQKAKGPLPESAASALQAAAMDDRMPGAKMSRDEARAQIKTLLSRGVHEKTFMPLVKEWLQEKHHLIHDPRPVPMDPFKDYYGEQFKWVYEDQLRFLYSKFPQATDPSKQTSKASRRTGHRSTAPAVLEAKVTPVPVPEEEAQVAPEQVVEAHAKEETQVEPEQVVEAVPASALVQDVRADFETESLLSEQVTELSAPLLAPKAPPAPPADLAKSAPPADKEEAEKQRLLEEEIRKKAEDENAERARKAAEDAAAQRLVDEELRKKQEEEQREAENRAAMEAQEREEKKRMLEEELERQKEEEAAARRRQEEADEAAQAQAAEEEAVRKAEEHASRDKAAAEEAARAAEEEVKRLKAEASRAADEELTRLKEEAEAKRREEEEAKKKQEDQEAAARRQEEELASRREEEQRKKDQEMQQVALALSSITPAQLAEQLAESSDGAAAAGDKSAATMSQLSPGSPAMQPVVSSSDLEEIMVGDHVQVLYHLYDDQEPGMEVKKGWYGKVEEINDGDAVILFYGVDEGRYVLRENFDALMVLQQEPSVSSSSAGLAQQCSEAVNQNEQLRAKNAALRVELDRLLAMSTPMSTPPLTGTSAPAGSARPEQEPSSATG